MKPRICHMTSVHPFKDGRIFYKECTSLVKAGYDVTLVAAGAQDEICNGVKIVGVPKASGRLERILKTTYKVYKKALDIDADIYHFHDPELLPFGLKLKKKGKNVVFDSHEFVGEQIKTKTYIPEKLRNLISIMYKSYEAFVCRRIDAVIEVCTIDGIDYFDGRCLNRFFITNAPILIEQPTIKEFSAKRLRKVVHAGSLTFERGITSLAQAITKTDCDLILIGKFSPDEYKKEISDICNDKLEYKGVVLLNELTPLLCECGIGTCTLLDKGQYKHIDVLPTKIYDYMVAGLPIIMSNFPYLIDFNNKYKVGVCVDPADPQAIADAINYIVNNPDEARIMGENGCRAVIDEFNWKIQEKELLSIYTFLTNS